MTIAHGALIALCLAAALAVTLVLAALLTPRSWWRRANAKALAVLVTGTAVFGALFVLAAGLWPHHLLPAAAPAQVMSLPPPPVRSTLRTAQEYRVYDDLNLRAASGTGAARIAVVPGGTLVTTTGRVDGDWWEVSAHVNGRQVTGWASSLWLRRGDEVKPGA